MTFFKNEFAKEVWQVKYAGQHTDVQQYIWALADMVSYGLPADQSRFYNLIASQAFSPGGRILAAAGRPNARVSLMNCTTHAIEGDSLEDINRAQYMIMRASSRGQGIGIDLSELRPRGAVVNNAANTSTGAISFMELLDKTGAVIGQEGRRAALLFSLRVDHPDIWDPDGSGYDFLHVKSVPGRVENANISVLITDEFMRAVKNDALWTLGFQGWSGGVRFNYHREVPAKQLFSKLAHAAHANAEPGTLFWDTSRRLSNSDLFGEEWEIKGVNACQPGFATVLAPTGIATFDQVQVDDQIWDGKKWVTITKKWSTGNKPVYEVITSRGRFVGTLDHKVFQAGQRVLAGEAESIDQIVGPQAQANALDYQAVLDGLVLGDGSFHRAARSQKIHLFIGERDTDYLVSPVADFIGEANGINAPYTYDVETTITAQELPHTYLRVIPERFYLGDVQIKRSFLRGLFSANGCVVTGRANRIGLKASSQVLIKQAQEMLSSLGIDSYITTSQEHEQSFSNGTYTVKESYDLNITGSGDLFMSLIGFEQAYKNSAYHWRGKINPSKLGGVVQAVNFLGNFPVYEITVDSEEHAYWTGGLKVSNCTEQVLDQEGVCNLGSMNLGVFVINPFTSEAYFDFKAFAQGTKDAVDFLDRILDVEIRNNVSISPRQVRSIEQLRRVGLGTMGLADAMAKMGILYGSEKSIEFAEQVHRVMAYNAYEASVELAEERGVAEVWKNTGEYHAAILDKGFFARLPTDLRRRIKAAGGTRNVTLMSVAPTGSISNFFGVSSGVEPIFAQKYVRRVRMNGSDELREYYHPAVAEGLRYGVNGSTWVTAYDIDPLTHVRVQAAIQQFVDQSISKTTNMPASATPADVAEVYQAAWELGCKGLAVYVDGSRHEQVLHAVEEKEDGEQCPSCGGTLIRENGCVECATCAWSACEL